MSISQWIRAAVAGRGEGGGDYLKGIRKHNFLENGLGTTHAIWGDIKEERSYEGYQGRGSEKRYRKRRGMRKK